MDEIRRILHNTVRETLSVPRRQILLNFKMHRSMHYLKLDSTQDVGIFHINQWTTRWRFNVKSWRLIVGPVVPFYVSFGNWKNFPTQLN
ncbi:hypothetical protein FPOA_08175 [Fusarium poae]|uniref:Uncharacterized protein n=1 Tax=Fusarium poae TaxID=36050 RepID=A0A1B8AMP9_FUSPO|nr:hypothetical protein FPOA_08175 [Fusarium poae]